MHHEKSHCSKTRNQDIRAWKSLVNVKEFENVLCPAASVIQLLGTFHTLHVMHPLHWCLDGKQMDACTCVSIYVQGFLQKSRACGSIKPNQPKFHMHALCFVKALWCKWTCWCICTSAYLSKHWHTKDTWTRTHKGTQSVKILNSDYTFSLYHGDSLYY